MMGVNQMPNPQYVAGRRFEYFMVNLLKKHLDPKKYTIIRTAGSHSPVDVFVIQHRNRRCFGIQCKSKLKGGKKNG